MTQMFTTTANESRGNGRRLRWRQVAIAVAALLLTAVLAAARARAATVTIGPADLVIPPAAGWWYVEETANATGSFIPGPAIPPLGVGSARMTLDATGREILGTLDYAGTRLDTLTTLQYSTYRSSVDPGNLLAISLQFDLDCDLTDADTTFQGRMVFEPYFTAGSGTILQNTWYAWDALDPGAKWWMSGTPRKANAPFANPCPQALPCTLSTILSTHCPDAGVRNAGAGTGALLLKAGGPWPSFDGNADALTIGISGSDTTYDFEPCAPRYVATTGSDAANDCIDGGSPCATIQHAIDVACSGDTVLVAPGAYNESPDVTKSLTIQSTGGRDVTTINLQTGPTYLGSLQISGSDVTVDGFTIVGRDAASPTLATSNIYIVNAAPVLNRTEIKNNRVRVGLCDEISGPPGACIDDGVGLITTYYDTGVTLNTLTVTDSIFEPLNSGANRAFYINPGVDAFTFQGNTITGFFDFSTTTQAQNGLIQDNVVDGQGLGGLGLQTWGYPDANVWGHTTFSGNLLLNLERGITVTETNTVVIACNRFSDNVEGALVRDGFGTVNFDPTTIDIHTNSFLNSSTAGVDNSASTTGTVLAENNWWGCVAGPGNAGCDSVIGDVDYTPVATAVPLCVNCDNDSQCDDGLACSGTESCNTGMSICQSGTAVNCPGDQCNTSACTEPAGTCVVTPKVDGLLCNDGDGCTTSDTCQSGVCVGAGGTDTDGDGYCDQQEIAASCSITDPREIPPQANVYSGGRSGSGGEILITFHAPRARDITFGTDPSCATSGACNLLSGFCISGSISDPCASNADCVQASGMCRVVVNYADSPDLTLLTATLKRSGEPKEDVKASFLPMTPGCTRKVDLTLPSGFRRAKLGLKASGTTSARLRKDRDVVKYRE